MTRVTLTVDVPDGDEAAALAAMESAAEDAGGSVVVLERPDYGSCSECGDVVTDIASESYSADGKAGRLERRYCIAGHRVETWVADEGVTING